MLKSYVNKWVFTGIFFVLLLLAWLAFSSFVNTKKLITSSRWVAHTHDVLYQTEKVFADAVNIELSQRGYAITGNSKFLEALNNGTKEIEKDFSYLKEITIDNPTQQKRLSQLELKINRLTDFTSNAVQARNESLEAAIAVNASLQGKMIMDSIRLSVTEIQQYENILLEDRLAKTENHIKNFNMGFIGLLLVSGGILVMVFYAINENIRMRIRVTKELKMAADEIQDLYDNAPCGYHSINEKLIFENINNTLIRWLGYNKQDVINRLNILDIIKENERESFLSLHQQFVKDGVIKDQEFTFIKSDGTELPVVLSSLAITNHEGKFIKSRTNTFDNTEGKQARDKILNLNKELEAFTYSVSHDLRAPLRSIDGYATILKEDYQKQLDAEGQRIINVIINNAKRMGMLIDDLLEFSRVGRLEVNFAEIEMKPIVEAIVKDLQEQEKDRNVEVNIYPLHSAHADASLIKQVWINLISNAFKYSSKREKSVITISSAEDNDNIIFSVSDNGVGFDMQYVNKLFGVFQRLHKISEFSGTGVGLAIVKRIISRHGGTAWAEAVLNEGATFYFSIPKTHAKQ